MGKGDIEAQKKKKPAEGKVIRDAEDVTVGIDVAAKLDSPYGLNVHSPMEYKAMFNHPLINREIMRREKEDSMEALQYQIRLGEQNPDEVIERAEKKWVGEAMDRLEAQILKRREEEPEDQGNVQAGEPKIVVEGLEEQAGDQLKEAGEQEAGAEAEAEKLKLQVEEQKIEDPEYEKQQEEERKAHEAKRLKEEKERVRLFASDSMSVTTERLDIHIPQKTALTLKYGSRFKDSISDKKRREKKKNPKSRLYQKIKNAELLNSEISKERNTVYKRADAVIGRNTDISAEDLNDLAQFMIYRDESKNKEICDLMTAARNKDGVSCVDEYHARLALVKMADQLMAIDLKGLKFDTDRDIAANAYYLESISNRLAAFFRLSAKYRFMETLDDYQKLALIQKIRKLKSVAAYYTVRKDIMNTKEYMDHYDDELSMDVTKVTTDKQRALAEKLVMSLVLGRNMMRINGVSVKNLNRLSLPRFKDHKAVETVNRIANEYSELNDENLNVLLKESYFTSDERAEHILDMKKEGPAMREEVGRNEPIESEEQAEAEKQVMHETGFADGILKTLLTSDELIPLKGSREMAAVRKSIQALQAMLTNGMPPVTLDEDGELDAKAEKKAKEEIDGTCLTVVMLYKRRTDSIDRLVKRYGTGYSDLADMLKGLSVQCKSESESFREKTLEYRDIVLKDPVLRAGKLTWMDALKFNRGVFYDLDNDINLSVKKDGAGASTVYRITRKVPVTADNPKGQEIVYFRAKDKVPSADDGELVDSVINKFELKEETAVQVAHSLKAIQKDKKSMTNLFNAILKLKKQKRDPAEIARLVLGGLNTRRNLYIKASEDEYTTLGLLFVEWRDTYAKRCMAHDMKVSAKIDCGRNLSDRNVATSRMAAMLGIGSVICDSRTAHILMDGKLIEGNLMEDTGGKETGSAGKAYTPKAMRQLFELQIFDFICGQTDRHFGNFHGKLKNGDIDQIRALDNDMSFGKIRAMDIGNNSYNRLLPVVDTALMGLSTSFVNRIMGLDRAYIEQTIGDILNSEEIDALMDRLDYVKLRITALPSYNESAVWDDKAGKLSYRSEFADEEFRTLWAFKQTVTRAERSNTIPELISKFTEENMNATPVDLMMRDRRKKLMSKKKKKK